MSVTEDYEKLKKILSKNVQQVNDCLEDKIEAMQYYRSLLLKEQEVLQTSFSDEISKLDQRMEDKIYKVLAFRNQLIGEKVQLDEFIQGKYLEEETGTDESEVAEAEPVDSKKSILTNLVNRELNALNENLKQSIDAMKARQEEITEEKEAIQEPLMSEIERLDEQVKFELAELTDEVEELPEFRSMLLERIENRFIYSHKDDGSEAIEPGEIVTQFNDFQKKKARLLASIQEVNVSQFLDEQELLPEKKFISLPVSAADEPQIAILADKDSQPKDVDKNQVPDLELKSKEDKFFQEIMEQFHLADAETSKFTKWIKVNNFRRSMINVEQTELQWVLVSAGRLLADEPEKFENLEPRMMIMPLFITEVEKRIKKIPFSKNRVRIPKEYWRQLMAYDMLGKYFALLVGEI